MSLVKLSRSLLNKGINKNFNEILSVGVQQKISSQKFSSSLLKTQPKILNIPKCVSIPFISNYSTDKGKVEVLFQTVQQSLTPELVKKVNSIYQFDLSGDEKGKWFLDLKGETGKYGKGEPPQPADVTLTMDSKNFLKMFDGKLKPTTAYMTGKLKIKGNLQVALKLDKIMGELKK
nr:hydroxysteroid dehydrogenase-like protein 2 [Onthophagus taurus]